MANSWKYYRAKAEQFRAYNVFTGPLKTEEGDAFVHYVRQGKLGNGTDFFGIYYEDHAAWLKVQPKDLGLAEVAQAEIPVDNPHTKLETARVDTAAKTKEGANAALALKGLPPLKASASEVKI